MIDLYTHQNKYIVNGKEYVAHAFFMGNMLHINNKDDKIYQCCLDDYTNYQGNMESFVKKIVSLKDKGLSQTKITMKMKGI